MTNNYVMLNNVEHQNVRVITEHAAKYGDNVSFVRVFPLEFRNLQSCYPVLIKKDANTGEFAPVALFGFAPDENLFLNDDGWDARYIPLMIRRHPFLIGFQKTEGEGDTRRAVVSIDMNSPRVSETEGEALFLEHGGVAPFLTSMTETLETIRLASEMSTGFIQALSELDLIEAVTMQVELDNGSKNELHGFYTVNEDKLQQLDGEALGRLNSDNYLESIYMMLASLSCFRALIDRKNARERNNR